MSTSPLQNLPHFFKDLIRTARENPGKTLLLGGLAFSTYFIYRNTKIKIGVPLTLTDHQFSSKCPLTVEEAVYRSNMISKLEYNLILNIQPGTVYEGRVTIDFDLQETGSDLFVDYFGQYIKLVVLNDRDITSENPFRSHRVHLPQQYLKRGTNRVVINFENDYANDGSGLHSFTDTDKNQYIYSQCAPCYAHKIFPCFDQPDLKASLKLNVIAPKDWKVVTNEAIENEDIPTQKYFDTHRFSYFGPDLLATSFNKSPQISTYLYAIIVGPYAEIRNTTGYKGLPMSLYCRKSVEEYAKKLSQMMFDVTCTGMKYYEELFQVPFAFSKYDLIFCPEFNWGAMENVGAVTFSETAFLHKEEMNELDKLSLAYVLLHELAHMWFGNLVTMKWWDDLWLNESFATFIGYHTLENHPDLKKLYPNAWVKMFFYKERGYNLDQLSTTHAIACHVHDTAESETIFDGITYSKGAAVLKQLVSMIGFTNFRDAMRYYFQQHQWRNADLEDFFDALKYIAKARNLNLDLDTWKKDWICTAGVNELSIFVDTTGQTTKLTIIQTAALKDYPRLRDHKLKAGLYYEDGSCKVVNINIIDESVNELDFGQLPKPTAILLNYDDEDFVKARIDEASLRFFRENLHSIQEALSRALVWKCLMDMTKDGKINAIEYVDFFIRQGLNEEQPELTRNILQCLKNIYANYIPNSLKPGMSSKIFNHIYTTILQKNTTLNPTRKHLYILHLTCFAENEHDLLKLADTLENGPKTIGTPAQSTKLEIIKLIYAKRLFDKGERDRLFNLINDKSSLMLKEKRRLEALEINDPQEREKLWETFTKPPSDISSRVLQAIMEGFNHPWNSGRNYLYAGKFFDNLLTVYENTTYDYFNIFYNALFPDWSEEFDEILSRLSLLLETIPHNYTPLAGFLRKSKEEVERIRRNKLLCTMSRSKASTIYSWVKAPKLIEAPKEAEKVIEERKEAPFFTRERQNEEIVRSVERPIQEERTKAARNVVIAEENNQEIPVPVAPNTEKSSDNILNNIETTVTIENAGEITPIDNSKFEERKSVEEPVEAQDNSGLRNSEIQGLRLSLGPEEEFQYGNLRLSLSFNEGKGDNFEEMLNSGDNSVRDDEEVVKNVLRKSWKKQTSYLRTESVFKDWVSTSKASYVNMFKADAANFSVHNFIKTSEEVKSVLENVFQKHYIKLVYVFLHYQTESIKYPEISWQEFSLICKNAKKVFGQALTSKDLDQIFMQEARETPRKAEINKDRTLCRSEFIDIILRMAIKKYMSKKESNTYNSSIDKFLENDFLPNVKSAEYSYEGYRYEKIHTELVDNVLKANEGVLEDLMKKYSKDEGKTLHLDEVKEMLAKGKFEINPTELLKCFSLSKMMVVEDRQEGPRKSSEVLVFPEFLEFVVRIAEVIVEEESSTAAKVEVILSKFTAALESA